jgi:hypothetical protein
MLHKVFSYFRPNPSARFAAIVFLAYVPDQSEGKVCHGGIPWATTIWKGQIAFGLVSFPVRLQAAARSQSSAVAVSVPALPSAVTVFGGSHCGSLLNG